MVGSHHEEEEQVETPPRTPNQPKKTSRTKQKHPAQTNMSSNTSSIPKLRGAANYTAWYNAIQAFCKYNKTWKYLAETRAPPTRKATEEEDDFQDRKDEYDETLESLQGLILLTVESGPRAFINGEATNTPKKMMDKLKSQYDKSGFAARYVAWNELTGAKLDNFKSVESFGESIRKSKEKLAELGYLVEPRMAAACFSRGLGSQYEDFIT